MGLDNMRASGRPPFFVGGLIVICIVLAFNWWCESSENYDLLKQLERVGEQLKICSDEQDVCFHQRGSAESRIKSLDGEIALLRVHAEQNRVENEEIKKRLEEKSEELKNLNKDKQDVQSTSVRCETELESLKKLDISKDGTIASLRLEKERSATQLEERKQEVQKLKLEITQLESQVKDLQAYERGQLKIPTEKNTPKPTTHKGDLKILHGSVDNESAGNKGLLFQREPIFPQDPPHAERPKPLLSVTYISQGTGPEPAKVENGAISVGENHDNARAQDVEKAEEENNAGERLDEANVENEPEPQLEEAERMEEANEAVVEDSPKKSGQDVKANVN